MRDTAGACRIWPRPETIVDIAVFSALWPTLWPISGTGNGTELDASRQISISCTDGEIVGTADCYRQLIQLVQRRIAELGITADVVDEAAGLSDRYCATLLSGGKAMSIYSFFSVLRSLALRPAFLHDGVQMTNVRNRSAWRPIRRRGARLRPGERPPDPDAIAWIGC